MDDRASEQVWLAGFRILTRPIGRLRRFGVGRLIELAARLVRCPRLRSLVARGRAVHDLGVAKFATLAGAVIMSSVVLVWSAHAFGASSVWFAFIVVWVPMVAVGLLSRVVQVRLPDRYHELRRFERTGRVYERIGVRAVKWMLRRGPLAVFNPDLHLPAERTSAKLAHLEQRMRDAEASHAVLFVATLPIVAHALVRGWWVAAAATLLFDLLMNGYPVILQRYNRARLAARFAPTATGDRSASQW